MNYYQARQRASDGQWDFTCKNDGRIWPVGYCKDHGDGEHHATKEEAQECFLEYLLAERLKITKSSAHRPCAVCGELGNSVLRFGSPGGHIAHVCDDHATSEVAKQLAEPPEIIWSS